MGEKKQTLRTAALARRNSLAPAEVALWARLIQERILHFSPYLLCRSVALYSPVENEVATDRIRDHALRSQKKLFYPKLGERDDLAMVRVESAEELKPGRYGILEPTGEKIMTKEDQEALIIFVPGLAFDRQGNRLGRGKGWYDRAVELLERGPGLIALAYEFQIVDQVPTEKWDRKIHYIITERRIIDCGDVSSQTGAIP